MIVCEEQEKRENRAQCPEVAAFVDAVRAVFPNAKVTYVKEGKVELGTRKPVEVVGRSYPGVLIVRSR